MNFVVGIDIAKSKFDAAYIDNAGHKRHAVFVNCSVGYRQLFRWLSAHPQRNVHLVMEATGNYWLNLAGWANQKNWRVSVINPLHINAYAKSIGQRSKTDKQDALLLHRYGQRENPPLWQKERAVQKRLDNLTRQLSHLAQQLSIERSRLQSMQADVWESIQRQIAFLEREHKAVEAEITAHIASDELLSQRAKLLNSIPGIGKKTIAPLLAFIGEPERFSSTKQAASLAGLAPRHYESGSSVKGQSRIGRGGDSRIRHALFMPAVAIGFGRYAKFGEYVKRLEQRGKRRKVIVIALMRKLLTIACAVLKSGVPYDSSYHSSAAMS